MRGSLSRPQPPDITLRFYLTAHFALFLSACRETPPSIDSCADPVGGVWRDPAGRGFHILDHGREVDVFPMWDTTAPGQGPPGATTPKPQLTAEPPGAPVRSPVRILLHERSPQAIAGTMSVRVDRCTVTSRALLGACHGRTAELSLEEEPTVNPLTCASTHSDRWMRVPLRRE